LGKLGVAGTPSPATWGSTPMQLGSSIAAQFAASFTVSIRDVFGVGKRAMLRRSPIVVLLIVLIALLSVAVLYVAYTYVASAESKDAPGFIFWMEVSKPIIYVLLVILVGGIIAGFLKILFDGVQARRQIEAAKDQFRKDIISGFINARYEATGKRDKFLSAPSDQLASQYRSMMEDEFIDIKEKLSRVWHDVETGKQSLTHSKKIQDNVITMKDFFDRMLIEYRKIKDENIPDSMDYFTKLQFFGDFLNEGVHFRAFLDSYRNTLGLVRLDLFGNK